MLTVQINPLKPVSYPQRLLVLVAGLTPQIVTETLYALTQQPEPFVPTHIHLITTHAGAQRAKMLLLNQPLAHFHKLCAELDLPFIDFSARNIHVLRDSEGEPLQDIRSPEENACVADQIMHLMRQWCSNEQAALHVSIAGGRKTMTYYLGTALSLFGRAQDRLSHILVDEAFEGHRDFFYPTKHHQIIYNRDNQPLNTAQARVSLAQIPFVRLASENPALLQQGNLTFTEMVDTAQQALGPLQLIVNPGLGELRVQGQPVKLANANMAFLLWFIALGRDSDNPWQPPSEGELCQKSAQEFLHYYAAIQKLHGGHDERPYESLRRGMDLDWFRNRVKNLRESLRKQLGKSMADKICIGAIELKPVRYGLMLPLANIQLEDFEL